MYKGRARNNYQKIYQKKGTTLNERVQFPDISDSSKNTIPFYSFFPNR